jgi:hypothetical protein
MTCSGACAGFRVALKYGLEFDDSSQYKKILETVEKKKGLFCDGHEHVAKELVENAVFPKEAFQKALDDWPKIVKFHRLRETLKGREATSLKTLNDLFPGEHECLATRMLQHSAQGNLMAMILVDTFSVEVDGSEQ